MSSNKTDTQAILVREFIYALHHSDWMLEKRIQHLLKKQTNTESTKKAGEELPPPRMLLSGYSSPKSQDYNGRRIVANDIRFDNNGSQVDTAHSVSHQLGSSHSTAPLVILELRKDSHIEFLDITPVPNSVSWAGKPDVDDIWSREAICVGNAEFTSGRVLLEEMLHGMITFSLPVSRFCMDTRVIDHFVEVVFGGRESRMPTL